MGHVSDLHKNIVYLNLFNDGQWPRSSEIQKSHKQKSHNPKIPI